MALPAFYRSCDIIEFIDGDDAEGCLLADLFQSHGVRYRFERASDYDSIEDLFASFTNTIANRNSASRANGEPLYSPELHISCHGCDQGIGGADGSLVSWERLAELLWDFSVAIGYVTTPNQNGAWAQTTSCVSLSLSCCNGASAASQFFAKEPFPVGGFMAPVDKIYIHDCANFFVEYYTRFAVEDPWATPEKVRVLNESLSPQGPGGEVPIQCYVAPLTVNMNFNASLH
jgi:hypothetical protein